jgi:hypothetical protein
VTNVSYATTFDVDAVPQDVFAAVTDVRGWWSDDVEGNTAAVGDEFVQRYGEVHRCRLRVIEAVPGRRVSWLVLENYFSFAETQAEWTGTTITFDIAQKGSGTEVTFTHQGLVPDDECYDVCSNAWDFLVNSSLRNLIATGRGQPTATEPEREEQA